MRSSIHRAARDQNLPPSQTRPIQIRVARESYLVGLLGFYRKSGQYEDEDILILGPAAEYCCEISLL